MISTHSRAIQTEGDNIIGLKSLPCQIGLTIQSDQTVDPGEEDSPVAPCRDSNPRPFDHES